MSHNHWDHPHWSIGSDGKLRNNALHAPRISTSIKNSKGSTKMSPFDMVIISCT